ncbi:hypothetical protein KEM55_002905, partial [Ascosphaera atra]
ASPCPVILYNYPGAVAGIDMDSDFIIKISQHPNIVGTKFTCANTGKLTRVASALNAITPESPRAPARTEAQKNAPVYVAFGGIADFALQTLVGGGSAILAGGANVFPRLCVEIFNLWEAGKMVEAIETQKLLSRSDWVLTNSSIPGTKSAIESYFGYGGYPRRPLKRVSEEKAAQIKEAIKEAMDSHNQIEGTSTIAPDLKSPSGVGLPPTGLVSLWHKRRVARQMARFVVTLAPGFQPFSSDVFLVQALEKPLSDEMFDICKPDEELTVFGKVD